MLALAASDLACNQPDKPVCNTAPESTGSALATASTAEQRSLAATAMNHRVLAIKSLQNALAKGVPDMETGNAMLATCYVLVFQSVLISDGFPEFMSFIRGCMVVAYQMGMKGMKFIFDNIMPDDQLRVVGPSLEADPAIPLHIMEPVIESLRFCEYLVVRPAEKEFFDALMEIVVKSQESAKGG